MLPIDKEKLNNIARLEKAVKKRWGDEAIKNPLSDWDEEKEKSFKEELASSTKKSKANTKDEAEERNGFFVTKRLLSRESIKHCSVCGKKISNLKDETHHTKWSTCLECYVKHIEDREARWIDGWRPNRS